MLYQICKPFNWFRRLLWWLMAAGIVLCFTLLGDILDLRMWTDEVRLVMFTLLVMTPTVFLAIQRVFDWCEQSRLRLAAWCRGLWAKRPFQKKKA